MFVTSMDPSPKNPYGFSFLHPVFHNSTVTYTPSLRSLQLRSMVVIPVVRSWPQKRGTQEEGRLQRMRHHGKTQAAATTHPGIKFP